MKKITSHLRPVLGNAYGKFWTKNGIFGVSTVRPGEMSSEVGDQALRALTETQAPKGPTKCMQK